MESSRRNSSEDYIDPHVLELQEPLGFTGTWMSDINNGDGSAPLDIMELDDIPDDVLLWDLSPATELPAANGSVAPAQYAAPAAPAITQPTAAPPFVFRPQAEIFRPQPQRPQLQL